MRSLRIQNFQAHADLEIEFDPHITTIVGPSDAGKSSVLRALKWVMMNEPRGAGFIRDGTKKASVTLEIEKGVFVTRTRGGDTNLYQLGDNDYKAFGNDVPIDIKEYLNVNHLNFQGQHDPPFWFTETAGEVSRQLNQIVDLGKIDSTLSAIDSIVRKTKMKVEILREQRENTKQRKNELKWVKGAHQELKKVETLNKTWKMKGLQSTRLDELVIQVKVHQDRAESATQSQVHGGMALKLGERWKALHKKLNSLEMSLETIAELEEKASQPLPPPLTFLEKLAKQSREMTIKKTILETAVQNLMKGQESLCQNENTLKKLEKRFQKEMGNRCPLCDNKIKL